MKTIFLYFLICGGVTPTLFAQDHIRVDIPQSDFKSIKDPPLRRRESTQLELLVSSWEPSKFEMPSSLSGASSFESEFPNIKLGFVSPLFPMLAKWGIREIFYMSYLELTRSAQSGLEGRVEQSANLLPFQLGLQYSPAFLKWKGIQPNAQAYLMPTVTILSDSGFTRGRTYLSWPYGFSLGATFSPTDDGRFGFRVATNITAGDLHDSSAFGVGFEGGLRFRL